MQYQPDAPALLEAVRELISGELLPVIEDRGLRFKALIAANVLAIVERELRGGEALLDAEIGRLRKLLEMEGEPPVSLAARQAHAHELNEALCRLIRAGGADEGEQAERVRDHVHRALVEQLEVNNPRFLHRMQ
jgi:hypothetical protein